MLKSITTTSCALALLVSGAAWSVTIPADGDAWTENSTIGWGAVAGTLSTSPDHMVGEKSITSDSMAANWPWISYTFATPIDASAATEAVQFYFKVTTNTAEQWAPEFRLFDGAGDENFLSVREATRGGNLAWTSYNLPLADFMYNGGVDKSHITKIWFFGYMIVGDPASTFQVDGLNFTDGTIPEPTMLGLTLLGSLALLRRRRNA